MPKDCTDWRKTRAELGNPKNTIEVLQKYQFHFAKKFGQNFLIDTHVLDKIVRAAEITPEDYVLEIGPGIGTLTQYLCESAKHVFAVEIDDNLIPILQDTLSAYDNVTVIHNDVLKLDINKLVEEKCEGKRIKVVANLPYYITSPICMRLIESGLPVKRMVLMMQVEVAERFFAAPRDVNYGPLSIVSRYLFDISTELKLSPAAYYPKPSVHSCVLKFERNGSELPPNFIKVLRAAFAMRRKTLRNNMLQLITKNNVDEVIADAGLLPTVRAEELTAADFVRLADSYNRYGNKVSEADPTCAE